MFIYKIDWLHFIAETVVRTSNLVKLYTGKSHDEKIHGFFHIQEIIRQVITSKIESLQSYKILSKLKRNTERA